VTSSWQEQTETYDFFARKSKSLKLVLRSTYENEPKARKEKSDKPAAPFYTGKKTLRWLSASKSLIGTGKMVKTNQSARHFDPIYPNLK